MSERQDSLEIKTETTGNIDSMRGIAPPDRYEIDRVLLQAPKPV